MAASLISAAIATAGKAFTMAAFLKTFVLFTVLGGISKALTKAPDFNSLRGLNFNIRDPQSPKKLIYGQARMGGTIVFIDTTGDDNANLHLVIALAGHEVDDITEIYFNDEKVWNGSGTSSAGNINGTYVGDWGTYTTIQPYNGAQTSSDSTLTNLSDLWTTDHILKDTAYLYVKLNYHQSVYSGGAPNISCVIKGKNIYDPRLDSTVTGGSGSHRAATSSTWAFSNNPSLVLLDYLRHEELGLGESTANIDIPSFMAAANICDEDVEINSVGSGVTQKRYTCDGVLNSGKPIKDNIDAILTSMMGTLNYVAGKFEVNAYAYRDPNSDTIDESAMVSPIQLATKQSRRSLYNAVKGGFVSEEENYVLTDYPTQISKTEAGSFVTDDYYYITDVGDTDFTAIGASANQQGMIFKATGAGSGTGKASAYAGEDGELVYLTLDFPMTTNNKRAQRLAKLSVLRSRLQATITFTMNLSGLKIKVGDNVKVTNARLGYSDKIFEVVKYSIMPDIARGLVVQLEATENASAAYNWATSDEVDFTTGGEIALYDGASINAPVLNSATPLTAVNADGTVTNKIEMAWSAVDDAFLDHYEIIHFITGSGDVDYRDASRSANRAMITGLIPATEYSFIIRAVNERGVKSQPSNTVTVTTGSDFTPKIPSIYRISKDSSAAPTASEFTAAAGRDPKDKDVVITTDTSTTPDSTHYWTYNLSGTAWVEDNDFITGDLIVDGTITSDHIQTNSLTVDKLSGDVTEEYAFSLYPEVYIANSSSLAYNTILNSEFDIPAPSLVAKRQAIDFTMNLYSTHAYGGEEYRDIKIKLQRKSKAEAVVEYTGSTILSRVGYVTAATISGNHTDTLSVHGGISNVASPSASYAGELLELRYKSSTNTTYIKFTSYYAVPLTDSTFHFSPDRWQSAGTWLVGNQPFATQAHCRSSAYGLGAQVQGNFAFPPTTTATEFRFSAAGYPYVYGMVTYVQFVHGTVRNVA
jgi:hypothetical protein